MSSIIFFNIEDVFNEFGLFYVNGYPFLMAVWNIVLAMVPFGFFLWFSSHWRKTKFKKTGQKFLAGLIFFLWFIFLPNSAYLIVGSRHLLNYCPIDSPNSVCTAGVWQIMFFFCYSVLGWVFFVVLLKQMKKLLGEIFGKKKAAIAIYYFIPLISWGVLIGLTERFNSWDILFHPLAILIGLLRYMAEWHYFSNLAVFIAGYYLLYFLGDFLFGRKVS